MKPTFAFPASLALLMPMAALAQSRLDLAVERVRFVDATSNRAQVECGDATGFVPLAGMPAIGGAGVAAAAVGLGVAAAAGGGGGSTSETR